jgi:hypothetical protein
MKKSCLAHSLLVLFFVSCIILPTHSPAFSKDLTLEDLVREVKVALLKVQQSAENDKLPPLSSAEIELNTVQSKNGEGKLSVLIVEIGGTLSSEITNTIKLTLVPPSSKSSSDVASVQFADALAESILSGARGIAAAKIGSPPLNAKELEATIKFVIKRDGNGKLSISFPPFELSAGGGIKKSSIQSIKVIYKYI